MFKMEPCCRLCLCTNNLVPIFDELGASLDLQRKILNRIHIYVDNRDYLPKAICFVCCGLLETFETFIKKSYETQSQLLKIVQNGKDNADVTDPPKTTPKSMPSDEEIEITEPIREVIEVKDESGVNTDVMGYNDSKVKITEINVKPLLGLFQPSIHEERDREFPLENDAKKEPEIKSTKADKNIQIGVSLVNHRKTIENKFTARSPQIPLHHAYIHTIHVADEGNEISMNRNCDKGVQIKVSSSYKARARSNKEETKSSRKVTRMRWSLEQKRILKERFYFNYLHKTAPSVKDTTNFLKTAGALFANTTCNRVQRFFYNRKYGRGNEN